MKDQLEDFVNQNRNAFDDKEPSDKVWRNIEASVHVQKKMGWFNSTPLWRAAAVIFMALSAYLFVNSRSHVSIASSDSVKPKGADMTMREFNDVEAFYVQQISEKVEMIDGFQKNEGLNGFTHDFHQLEAMYMVLKDEMKSSPSEKVKDALVLNLLVRIDLLNQQLHKLEKEYKPVDKKQASI